jgi:hypothetical protein
LKQKLLNCSKELVSLFTGRLVLASSPGVTSLLFFLLCCDQLLYSLVSASAGKENSEFHLNPPYMISVPKFCRGHTPLGTSSLVALKFQASSFLQQKKVTSSSANVVSFVR